MKVLFIFMDGVGLGADNPSVNPFVQASLPNLDALLGGKLTAGRLSPDSHSNGGVLHTEHLSMLALDACLGVDGAPQSASGQASLLTGKNVPAILGYHDGPKPSPRIMEILQEGTLFSELLSRGRQAALLNAFPPRYFKSIEVGYRLPGVIALSAKNAGIQLKTKDDLYDGEAISADFTAQGWRDQLGFDDTPLLDPIQAGMRMSSLSNGIALSFFEYWLSDVAGHRQDMQQACDLLADFDAVLGGLVGTWKHQEGLIVITSDHGNLEDLSLRQHTRNEVPLLLIGARSLRESFIAELVETNRPRQNLDLTHVTPALLRLLLG